MTSNALEKMLGLLTSAYTRSDLQGSREHKLPKTNIGKLFSAFSVVLDRIQESAELIRLWDNIDYAKGAALDRYGSNFGVSREGTDDAFYRLLIQVKMIALLSGGDINTVINAMAALFNVAPEKIELQEVFPAKLWVFVNEEDLDAYHLEIVDLIARVSKRIIAAGVGKKIFLRENQRAEAKLFLATAYAQTSHTVLTPPLPEVKQQQRLYVAAAFAVTSHFQIGIQDANSYFPYAHNVYASSGAAETVFIRVEPAG